jgi:FkbM family methyltransferase
MKDIRRILKYVQHQVRRSLDHLRVRLIPRKKLSSIDQFKRDGWANKIYSSVPALPNSSIVVFGGYKGDSTNAWLRRLPDSHVNVFEPVGEFAQALRERFNSRDVTVHEFGISKASEQKQFVLTNDSTFASEIQPKLTLQDLESQVCVQFLPVSILENLLPSSVEVLEINIEGGEYELISLLCSTKFFERVNRVFVQFHPVHEHTARLIESARNELSKTHKQVWSYDMVWEMWEKI